MPVDKFGRMSDTKTKDTGVSLTYINNNYIRSDGNTPVTGSIDMKGNTLYNVFDPVNPQDVATKGYVDETVVNTVTSQIKQINQLVSVSASYYGDLVKDEYQFTFGGPSLTENNFLRRYNGFLVPTFGVIKHFAIKPSGLKLEVTRNAEDSFTKTLIKKYGLVDNPTPLYTLVLIKDDIGKVIDVGTLFFYFTNFTNIFFTDKNKLSGDLDISFQFKPKRKYLGKAENFICSVNKGDIVNIRSEFTEENSAFSEDGDYFRRAFPFALNRDYYKDENIGGLDYSFTHLATLTFLFKEMSFPNVLELDPL